MHDQLHHLAIYTGRCLHCGCTQTVLVPSAKHIERCIKCKLEIEVVVQTHKDFYTPRIIPNN